MRDLFLFQKSFYIGCAICAKESFLLASKGKEEVGVLLWRWSLMSYLLSYVVFYQLIQLIGSGFISGVISLFVIAFYIWHIVAIIRCLPKKKKLSKTEKKQKKLVDSGSVAKSFTKKLLLQEPWVKTKNSSIVLVIDLLVITVFAEYLI